MSGEQQRGVDRARTQNGGSIVLADEPTGALDSKSARGDALRQPVGRATR